MSKFCRNLSDESKVVRVLDSYTDNGDCLKKFKKDLTIFHLIDQYFILTYMQIQRDVNMDMKIWIFELVR